MIDYENMSIERDRPDYPSGLKHFDKDSVLENAIFDFEMAFYKLKGLLVGDNNEKENIQNGTEDEEET